MNAPYITYPLPITYRFENTIIGYICKYDKVDQFGEIIKKDAIKIPDPQYFKDIPVYYKDCIDKKVGIIKYLMNTDQGILAEIDLDDTFAFNAGDNFALGFGFIRKDKIYLKSVIIDEN